MIDSGNMTEVLIDFPKMLIDGLKLGKDIKFNDVNDIVIRIDPLYPGINTPDIKLELLSDINNVNSLKVCEIIESIVFLIVLSEL